MPKLYTGDIRNGQGTMYLFYCPGCKRNHTFNVRTDDKQPSWNFNGNMDKPTFTPSLLYDHDPLNRCHLFVTDGMIEYCNDCNHELANKKVPMVDLESININKNESD